MTKDTNQTCPSCGIIAEPAGGTSPRLNSSAGCWTLYCRILEKEFSNPDYLVSHRVTVDAYGAQHPDLTCPRGIRSLRAHLVSLYLTCGLGWDGAQSRLAMGRLGASRHLPETKFERPNVFSSIKVDTSLLATDPLEHRRLTRVWAQSVWKSWSASHQGISDLARLMIT